jgi:hypothetical protein
MSSLPNHPDRLNIHDGMGGMSRPHLPINKKSSQLPKFHAVPKTTGGLTEKVVAHRMTHTDPKTLYPPPTTDIKLKLNLNASTAC